MKVLVTGSEGKVGSAVCSKLAEAGHKVVRYDKVLGLEIENDEALLNKLKGCEVVVHCAAIPHPMVQYTEEDYLQQNSRNTEKVFFSAYSQGIIKFIYISSLAVYARDRDIVARILPELLRSYDDYVYSKQRAESFLYSQKGLIDTLIIRLGSVNVESIPERLYSVIEAPHIGDAIVEKLGNPVWLPFEITALYEPNAEADKIWAELGNGVTMPWLD